MGVEDGKHGEQERDGMALSGKGVGRPTETSPGKQGPDSKHGGEGPHEGYPENGRGGHGGDGEGSPPNSVAMPIMARGHAATGTYGNTGDSLNKRGSLGNTTQDSYNAHAGHGRHEGGAKGEMLGVEPSKFYNERGGDKNDPDGGGSPKGKRIEGFGGGKSTFEETSNFYNDLGEGHESDAEGNSGSGKLESALRGGGRAKTIRGFTNDSGLKSGMV